MATNNAQPDRPLSDKAQRLAQELAQNPQSKVFVSLAEEYTKLGLLDQAAQVLEEGIGHYPGYVIAMVALGAVYFEKRDHAAAKDVLEAAIETSRENMKAHRVLAQIYAAEGNIEAARRSCTVVLMTNPTDELIKKIQASLSTGSSSLVASPPPSDTSPESLATSIPTAVETFDASVESVASAQEDVANVTMARGSTYEEPAPIQESISVSVTEPAGSSLLDAQPSNSSSRHQAQLRRLRSWLSQIQSSRRAA
ncbi:MAG: tetratricopeptide repeat protein [Nitrospiraceae bacterium]